MQRIEQVGPGQLDEALALVVGGGRVGAEVSQGAASLRRYLDGLDAGAWRGWWSIEGDRPIAAALGIVSPGRTAMVLHSSCEARLVPPEALIALLAELADKMLAEGLALVQGLLEPHRRDDRLAFEQAGFSRLAELIYMRLNLRGRSLRPEPQPSDLDYRTYDSATHDAFARTISSSYRNSLDCPVLEGVRDVEDIIAGHKASGTFRPDLWYVASWQGQPAGVILMNQSGSSSAEVVYMGVGGAFRGRGLGRVLLRRAIDQAGQAGLAEITLAVDANNAYALRLYEDAGFVETARRLAYVRTARATK